MRARVNGEVWSQGDADTLYFGVGTLIAHAARDSVVRAGDVSGSGTVTEGCILELMVLRPDSVHWLGSTTSAPCATPSLNLRSREQAYPRRDVAFEHHAPTTRGRPPLQRTIAEAGVLDGLEVIGPVHGNHDRTIGPICTTRLAAGPGLAADRSASGTAAAG